MAHNLHTFRIIKRGWVPHQKQENTNLLPNWEHKQVNSFTAPVSNPNTHHESYVLWICTVWLLHTHRATESVYQRCKNYYSSLIFSSRSHCFCCTTFLFDPQLLNCSPSSSDALAHTHTHFFSLRIVIVILFPLAVYVHPDWNSNVFITSSDVPF